MNLLWRDEKHKQLTMHVSLQVMSDFADAMLAIASRSQIVPAQIKLPDFHVHHPGSEFDFDRLDPQK